MKRRVIITMVTLICVHWMNETAELLERASPRIANTYIHPFISHSYRFPVEQGILIKWWVKYCTDDNARIVVFLLIAYVLWVFSRRMSMMFLVYAAYHCFDHLMLWYDYKQSHSLYWVEGVCNAVSILILWLPERKGAKIKSMN